MDNMLEINNLKVSFFNKDVEQVALRGVSLSVVPGETLALVGESGCGKTVLCKSMLHILCSHGTITDGEIVMDGKHLEELTDKEMQDYRGGRIAMVFQDPMTSLDPAFSVGQQIAEAVRLHAPHLDSKARAIQLMEQVRIPHAAERFNDRPYQFSGGMRQRIVIAIALAGEPQLLLADEPTTALDEDTRYEILDLLKNIQQETNVAMLFITHDLSLVQRIASRVAVMKDGSIVETGAVEDVFERPAHEYTRKLLRYLDYGRGRGHNHRAPGSEECLLQVEEISKSYGNNRVFDDISFSINRGEVVGIAGTSGCGKSTLARCIMNIEKVDAGRIRRTEGMTTAMIFQDSQSAFNERMQIREIIAEPLRIQGMRKRGELTRRVEEAAAAVGMDTELLTRRPYELSGGQRQRTAIARAIITGPDLLLADEPLTGLDVSAQADIVHLLEELVKQRNMALIIIAHDLPMISHISNRIIRI